MTTALVAWLSSGSGEANASNQYSTFKVHTDGHFMGVGKRLLYCYLETDILERITHFNLNLLYNTTSDSNLPSNVEHTKEPVKVYDTLRELIAENDADYFYLLKHGVWYMRHLSDKDSKSVENVKLQPLAVRIAHFTKR